MQDTCRIHAGYMLKERIFSQHVDTCRIHARHARYKAQVCILAQPIRYMQDTCRIHAGYMQDTCGIRGSSVYLGTAVQIRSRYAGYVLKMCRICAGTGCADVSRVGLEIWRQGGMRWRTNQASMYFILCVRYTQDTSGYITIHEAQCISIANHKIREYVSEYIRILQNTVFSHDTPEYVGIHQDTV